MNESTIDGLAKRVEKLAESEIAATGPLLALLAELLDDARRQYDRNSAAVLVAAAVAPGWLRHWRTRWRSWTAGSACERRPSSRVARKARSAIGAASDWSSPGR